MTVRENARFFEGGSTLSSLIRPLAAQIEDGFKELALMRSELKLKPFNSIAIQGLQCNHVFAILQILPRDRSVVTLACYKLLNASGTAMTTGNAGTSRSRSEVRSILVSRQHGYFFLRRNAGVSDDPR